MAVDPVVAVLSVEGVVGAVAGDFVVAVAGIDVFDGDETVFAITGVLPGGGVEVDAVVFARELSGVAPGATVDGVVAVVAVDPVVAGEGLD